MASAFRRWRPLITGAAILATGFCGALVLAWLHPGYVECPGVLEPDSWVPVFSGGDGPISSGSLKDGDVVVEGETVLVLDRRWPRWNGERVADELADAVAEVEYLSRQRELYSTHRRVEEMELRRLLEADRRLYESSSLALTRLERSEFLLRSFIAGAEREESKAARTLRRAESDVVRLEMEKKLWNQRLEDCLITAPVSGRFYSADTVLESRFSEFLPSLGPGYRLETGRLLGYVIPQGGIELVIAIPVDKISRCEVGQRVLASMGGNAVWGNPPLQGVLVSLSNVASGGGFTGIVRLDASSDEAAALWNCASVAARVDTRGLDRTNFGVFVTLWDKWVFWVNPPGSTDPKN